MKQFVFMVGALVVSLNTICQVPAKFSVSISPFRTTSLLFPSSIRHVDRGSEDVLVEQVSNTNNILLVKAATRELLPTNLTVVTADGSLYPFEINYDSIPAQTLYKLPSLANPNGKVKFNGEILNEQEIKSYSNIVLAKENRNVNIRDSHWQMDARVNALYIKDNIVFYQLQIKNYSNIGFDVDLIKFYIRDKKKAKKTAFQEIEVKPLYTSKSDISVEGQGSITVVFAFEKFTIPEAKVLEVEILERNGGRNLKLSIKNKHIIRAKKLDNIVVG